MKHRYIKIRDQYEGFHTYEDAPDEVAFLRHNHRHIFHVEVLISVEHNERELEFFMVKEQVRRACAALTIAHPGNLGSCENQAEEILDSLKKLYGGNRAYRVEVSEDGENAAVVEYEPEWIE